LFLANYKIIFNIKINIILLILEMSGKKPAASSAATSAANWDPFGDKAVNAAFGNLSSPAKAHPSSLEKMGKELDDIKIALADIYTRLPLDRENQAFVSSEGLLSDGIAAGAVAANTFVPGAATLARGAVATVKAGISRFTGRKTFEQELESLKKFLNDALRHGTGASGSLSRTAYPIVLGFMSLENPTLADVTKLRADIALSRANIGSHWKDRILLKSGVFRRFEAQAEESGTRGGRKTRALRRNRQLRGKTAKSQRRL
jgi:hypothetical protein